MSLPSWLWLSWHPKREITFIKWYHYHIFKYMSPLSLCHHIRPQVIGNVSHLSHIPLLKCHVSPHRHTCVISVTCHQKHCHMYKHIIIQVSHLPYTIRNNHMHNRIINVSYLSHAIRGVTCITTPSYTCHIRHIPSDTNHTYHHIIP